MKKTQLLLWLALLALTGCSSFHRDWRKAGKSPTMHGVQGRWEGTWISNVNGHGGKLRCLLKRTATETYEARFHAKYKRILGFGYTATLTGATTNGTFRFSGDADLGALAGGVYRYEGAVSPTNFFSTYKSKYDHGTFQMRRPKND